MCDHMFPDIKLGRTFRFYGYVIGLYSFLSPYVKIFHLIQRWECVVIYCNFIPDSIESTPERILFATQYRTKFVIPLGEVFRKYYRVISKTASIYLDCLIATASRVLSTRVFPRP